ncbi:MAG: HIT family protein [Betaproteobacteria bacterium]|nr:HIT family protein [Betaproteobacteria bacterium]MBI2959796.1 HIT family protein [Betaproteobacteria bacterium]
MEDCIFCHPKREILLEDRHALAIFDAHPVSRGHALIVPRRHVATLWDLDPEEYAACFALVRAARPVLESRFSPDGFNVGANCGEAAGQTVWHAHIHLIPRYRGDVPNPRGGVRNMLPHAGHH